jgi:hypothetical protein
MMTRILRDVLQRAEAWPQEDQEALAEYARELEARRTGTYRLTDEERAAIGKARSADYVRDDEMEEYWKSQGIA